VTNNEPGITNVSYTDCQTGPQQIQISPSQSESFCSCNSPESTPPLQDITILLNGPCNPTPP
jgi:hypothetical protein